MHDRVPDQQLPASFPLPAILAIFAAAVTSIALRLSFFADSHFPINDGGLFYVFVTGIIGNHFTLPATVYFNGFSLPFAYPPLSFWFGALISSIFNVDPLIVVRYYPFAAHLVFLVLYVPFLRSLRVPSSIVVLATTVFLLSHRSFEYLIMGGGLSRATGAAFTLASLIAAVHVLNRRTMFSILGTSICIAFSILSHLEWGIVSASGVTLVTMFYGAGWKRNVHNLFIMATLATFLVLPWVGWVVYLHGTRPFLEASQTSGWRTLDVVENVIELGIFPAYIRLFCVIGMWENLKKRHNFWLAFTIVLAFVTPRHFASAAVISNSVLAAVGIVYLLFVIEHIDARRKKGPRLNSRYSHSVRMVIRAASYLVLVLYLAGASYVKLSRSGSMGSVSAQAYEAMNWIRSNVRENAIFVVISPDPWYIDEVNEWFPVITGAVSLTTVQGTEWISVKEFQKREGQTATIKNAGSCGAVIEEVLSTYKEAEYVMATAQRNCFDGSAHFSRIFANAEASVYAIDKGTETPRNQPDHKDGHEGQSSFSS